MSEATLSDRYKKIVERKPNDAETIDRIVFTGLPEDLATQDIQIALNDFTEQFPVLGEFFIGSQTWTDNPRLLNLEIRCEKEFLHACIAPYIQKIVAFEVMKHQFAQGIDVLKTHFKVGTMSGHSEHEREYGGNLWGIISKMKEPEPKPQKTVPDDFFADLRPAPKL